MSNASEPCPSVENRPATSPLVAGQGVSLGCGSLILIALIVLIFGRGNTSELEREVRSLRSEIGDLKKSIEAQTNQIQTWKDKLEKSEGELQESR